MFVHWWNTVESQGVVMQLVQVGVSGLVHMRSGGGLNLNNRKKNVLTYSCRGNFCFRFHK